MAEIILTYRAQSFKALCDFSSKSFLDVQNLGSLRSKDIPTLSAIFLGHDRLWCLLYRFLKCLGKLTSQGQEARKKQNFKVSSF